jgi:hypothetical protein
VADVIGVTYNVYSADSVEISINGIDLASDARAIEPKHGVIYSTGPVVLMRKPYEGPPLLRWVGKYHTIYYANTPYPVPRNFGIGTLALAAIRAITRTEFGSRV